jgi:hypothetical protein
MGGGLMQLVAYGVEDMYLTNNPQITYFKVVYRRHTQFTTEQIPHLFQKTNPTFGESVSCVVSRNADLIGNVHIVVKLPKVRTFTDTRSKFAWVRRIGFALIKNVEIEINGRVIDKHYGEWLNLWSELTGEISGSHSYGFKKMIGDVSDLTDFSSSKDEYILYIPLYFWFCRSSGNALPLVSLQYSDIKINVEFEELENCYLLGPTHYIKCRDDLVNYTPYEYIEQNVKGTVYGGVYMDFDVSTKRLYYYKVTNNKLISYSTDTSGLSDDDINALLATPTGLQYQIVGKSSGFSTYAEINYASNVYSSSSSLSTVQNLNFSECFLLIDYYYLDEDERLKFSQSKHDYLIEQLYYTPDISIDGIHYNSQIIVDNPCKFMAWVVQTTDNELAKDYFNYTDTYQRKLNSSEDYDGNIGDTVGDSLVINETILYNGNERLSSRDASYFNHIQPYQYTKANIPTGINFYSFSLYPFMTQPSGSCNMSHIENLNVSMDLSLRVSPNFKVVFRGYCLCYGILRIVNGLAGLVFIR